MAAALLADQAQIPAIALAALGCGLQNSLAAHYRGVVLRTTHVTGLVTDLGVSLGMRLRGHAIESWKIAVPAWLVVSYFLGGVAAGLVHAGSRFDIVLVAGCAYVVAGLAWIGLRRHFAARQE
jgi:uncharacterized membrane protein YoaK (UPF0700 family)